MTNIPFTQTPIFSFSNLSLRKMVLVALFFTSLIPLAFVVPSFFQDSWKSVYQDSLQNHKLLASSLVEPIRLSIQSEQNKLESLDNSLQTATFDNKKITQDILRNFANTQTNVNSVSLLLLSDSDSPIVQVSSAVEKNIKGKPQTPDYIAKELRYQKYGNESSISSIFKSSLSNSPVFLIKHPVIDRQFNKIGTLFAELSPAFIQQLCSNISFGQKGHCAVVDDNRNVVAHPDKAKVSRSLNLGSHPLVQKIGSSNIGSLEYVSTTDNIAMLGGYAKIKNLDWGIIISRPKSEIELPLNAVKKNALIWLLGGISFALLLSILAIVKITRPLNILTDKTNYLTLKQDTYSLVDVPKHSSSDIKLIWKTLSKLLIDYQKIKVKNVILETTPDKDLRKVLANIRAKNIIQTDNIDPETGLTNLPCFLEELRKSLILYRGETVGLIIVEVDNYKRLMSEGNIQLSNYIIKHVADILNSNKRSDDMVARYGNDGRFAVFITDCSAQSLQGMAKKLRSLVEVSPILWKGDNVFINLSTGIVAHKIIEITTVQTFLKDAELALENSKTSGEYKNSDQVTQKALAS